MKVIACIEGPEVIRKILTHLCGKGQRLETTGLVGRMATQVNHLCSRQSRVMDNVPFTRHLPREVHSEQAKNDHHFSC